MQVSAAIAVSKHADTISGIEQYAVRAFAEALDDIPMALAENSGMSPISALSAVRARQVKENNHRIGVSGVMCGRDG